MRAMDADADTWDVQADALHEFETSLEEAEAAQRRDPAAGRALLAAVIERVASTGVEAGPLYGLGALARALRALWQGEPAEASREAQQALEHLSSRGQHKRGLALQVLGRAAVADADYEAARGYFREGLRDAVRTGDRLGEGLILTMLASLEMRHGDLDAANEHGIRARRVLRRVGDRAAEEKAAFTHGTILNLRGAAIEALAAFQESADLCEEVGHHTERAVRLVAAADAQVQLGMIEQAVANASEARDVLRRTGDARPLSYVLAVLASCQLHHGDLEGAAAAAEERLEFVRKNELTLEMPSALLGLARVHLEAGRLDEADRLAHEGLDQVREGGSPWEICNGLVIAGEIARIGGRFDEAIDRFQSCLAHIAPDDRRRQARVQGELATAYEERGDLPRAIEALRLKIEHLEAHSASEAGARVRHVRAARRVEKAEAAAAAAERRVSRALLEGQEEERRYVARELHDDLSQRLALLTVGLDALEAELPEGADDQRRRARELGTAVRDVAAAMHSVSRRLHPATLERLGLLSATRSFLKEIAEKHGVEVTLTDRGMEHRLGNAVELCLFRVIQEGLHNVVRHSGGHEASVSLAWGPHDVRLLIEDPGRGFDPAGAADAGIGIIGMRERVRHVGGTIRVESAPGAGSRIEVRIPHGTA